MGPANTPDPSNYRGTDTDLGDFDSGHTDPDSVVDSAAMWDKYLWLPGTLAVGFLVGFFLRGCI